MKRLLATGLLLGCMTASNGVRAETIVPVPEQMDDASARLTMARILAYRKETLADAVATYERLLHDNPRHGAALSELAELRIRQGNLSAAEEELRRSLAAQPGNPAVVAALARVLWWAGRVEEARTLLESSRGQRPMTRDEQIIYAQILGSLGRHADANRLFDEILAGGETPEILTMTAEARMAAGEIAPARELYQRALAVNPDLAGAQRGLALTMAWSGDNSAALPRLAALLREGGSDPDLVHAYVRAVEQVEGTPAAIARARQRAEAEPRNARWRAEWAELEIARGHAVQARSLLAEAVALENSPEMRLRAGKAAITWGDFKGAEKALREALTRTPNDGAVRDELGRLLVSVDRNEEAEQFYHRWLLDQPAAEQPRLGFIRLRMKEKDFTAALAECDSFLMTRPDAAEPLRLKAETLLAMHRGGDAAAGYEQLGRQPMQRYDALIGRGRAVATNDPKAASAIFAEALAMNPARPAARFHAAGREAVRKENFLGELTRNGGLSAPQLVEWAGLYAELGDFGSAVRCLKAARLADPDYYPAWAQLAEFLAINAEFDASLREFAALKKVMPNNRQVLLGEARALAWGRRYEDSLAAYAGLVDLNAADPVPRREAARTAGWGKMRDRGAALYATAWSDMPVDRILQSALRPALEGAAGSELIAAWRRWAEEPTFAREPYAWTERFAAERFSLRDSLPENRRRRIDEIYVQTLAGLRLQRAWWLENAAKQQAWDRRYTSSEMTFRRLLDVEPGNEEAMFDLSQVQAAQGLGQLERATLARLIELDANHSLATSALRRRQVRSEPVVSVEGRYWREEGRGELSSLARSYLTGTVQDTYADRYVVRIGGQLGREVPMTRSGRYSYRSFLFGAEGVVNSWLSGSASMLHREFYDGRIGHADSGQAQLWLKRNSHAIGAGYEKREELTNEWALFQGTRSDNLWLSGIAAFTRNIDAELRFTSTDYSDGNKGTTVILRPAIAWTDHPRIFKTILTLTHRDTDEETIYVNAGGKLTNLIHPYWTPQNYTGAALTFEWYNDLARQFFVGSEQNFYDLRLTLGTDTEANVSMTFEGDWEREWIDQWMIHAGVYLNWSKEWEAVGANLQLRRRF